MRSLLNLQRAFLSGGLLLGLLVLPVPNAAGQIPRSEANCINALNKAGWKLAKVQAKHLQVCIQSYLRGGPSADVCAPTDPKGRIGRAKQRTMNEFQRKCTTLPGFGPQDPNQVNATARGKEFELYERVFGSSLDQLATDANDPLESRCIHVIAKSLAKCEDAKLKEFVKCKKAGLKDLSDPIESAGELQDRCLGTGSDQQPDPLNKIQKKCTDPSRGFIFKYMQKSCVEKQVNLVSAFGSGVCAAEAAVDGPTLAACIEREVECAVCRWANATDGLSRDCDLFDNGLIDGSCPAICGDGYREGSEECDGTDDAACNAGPCLPNCSCGCDCCSTGLDLLSFETTVASGSAGVLRNFRCSNNSSTACVEDGDCDFGPCITGGPDFCSGNYGVPCTTDEDCTGVCEEVGGGYPTHIEAGRLYTGGGLNSVVPTLVPDQAKSFSRIVACNSTSGELTLGATTPGEVGERHCTSGRRCSTSGTPCLRDIDCPGQETCEKQCFFGAPMPAANVSTPATSYCVVADVGEDASGTASCNGSVSDLSLPLRAVFHRTGDLFNSSEPPDIPGVQPCPICDTLCQGGTKHRFPCADDSDCPESSCGTSPQCLGGPNKENPCTPETSGTAELGDGFPTSQDCPPDPYKDVTQFSEGIPMALSLTTGSINLDAIDQPSSARVFFGFCRDMYGQESFCFEGEPEFGVCWWRTDGLCVDDYSPCEDDSDCPGSFCFRWLLATSIACRDESDCPEDGHVYYCASSCDCPPSTPPAPGAPVSCTSDADCADGDEYESCAQRDPGAFSNASATRIEVSGDTDGQCLADGEPHASELVSIFAIPPVFDTTADAAWDLPGPGGVVLQGETRLE